MKGAKCNNPKHSCDEDGLNYLTSNRKDIRTFKKRRVIGVSYFQWPHHNTKNAKIAVW